MKELKEINVIFTIGYRCYSTDFLIKYELRKFSSPFDYLIIDFETSLKNINNHFNDFLNDIIFIHYNENKIEFVYNKNTTEIDNRFYQLLENNIYYRGHNYRGHYNNIYLIFNQNYLDNKLTSYDYYEWNKICCFMHYFILDENICNKIKNRCERFNNIMNKYNKTTSLFYITKIIICDSIIDYMNKIIELKKLYNISCFLIMIINCNIDNNHYYYEIEKCLFIIKKVENYNTEYEKYQIDENLKNFDNEYNIILKYFNFNLIEINDI
jgi:hypothetical protein